MQTYIKILNYTKVEYRNYFFFRENIGEIVYVYTTGGKLTHSVKVANHIIDIPLVKGGVYIVKVGGKTVKLGF